MGNGAHRRWRISDWQQMFATIYGHRNIAAGPAGIWSRLLEEIGELVRETRYRNRDGMKYHLPDIFAWLCAFCSVQGFDLQQIVSDRYRGGCPWCKNVTCLCPPGPIARSSPEQPKQQKKAKRQKATSPTLLDSIEGTLGDWESRLNNIYGERNSPLEWLQLAARLTEQAGYVTKTIRLRQETEVLRQGIADVFAWSVALFNSLKATGLTQGVELADFVFDKYPNFCPKCRATPCACPAPVVRVFVSSVMDETREERSLARDVLCEGRFVPVMFEDFKGQFFFDQQAEALKHLQECDLLLMILDNSITQPVITEFYLAVALQIPVRHHAKGEGRAYHERVAGVSQQSWTRVQVRAFQRQG